MGGRGDRLRPIIDNLPKPLVPVNGVPFLDYLFQTIAEAGMLYSIIVICVVWFLPQVVGLKKYDIKSATEQIRIAIVK